MPVVNHIHTYVRYKNKPGYYRCDAPDCTHFRDVEAIQGKLSRCTICGDQMILSREDLRRARPRCLNCSDTKKSRIHKKAQELTKYLGTDKFADTIASIGRQASLAFPYVPPATEEVEEEDLEEERDEPEDKWRLRSD